MQIIIKTLAVLKAVKVAMHRAFAPQMLNSENCSPSLIIAGWMSPFTT
jgi:hypothetical protein